MKQKTLVTLLFIFAIWNSPLHAQKCASTSNFEKVLKRDPMAASRRQALEEKTLVWIQNRKSSRIASTVVTIPVVVHVLYNTETENISDSQIASQIEILNKDFRLLNTDKLSSSHAFASLAADIQVEFCLAKRTPDGKSTTGITRTHTDSTAYSGEGSEKKSSLGGKDNWDPTQYLNLWVCNLGNSDGTLGYAAFPSEMAANPADDGVVIDFRAFGNIGTAGTDGFDTNNLGRTATHEVGHWLNLFHIWGDDECGDDEVSDTPPQLAENEGCPNFPHNVDSKCSPGANGEMFMNYMDYVDDNCMVMFTKGQNTRMRAAIDKERVGLLTSKGCLEVGDGLTTVENNPITFEIYPNPSNNKVYLNFSSLINTSVNISVSNSLGERVVTHDLRSTSSLEDFDLQMGVLPAGIYVIHLETESEIINKKIIINE